MMPENESNDFDGMLDDVLGGQAEDVDHSPVDSSDTAETLEAEPTVAPEAKEEFVPYEDDESLTEDSARDEGKEEDAGSAPPEGDSPQNTDPLDPDTEREAFQKELAKYEKRLHDTQKAMHEAKAERAAMQKELEELKKKSSAENRYDDEENWFEEEGDAQPAVEEKLKNLEQQQEEFQREMLKQQWMNDAKVLSEKHEDFDDLVFRKLEPLLDEETGDERIRTLYLMQDDRTPAGAYKFAKRLQSLIAALDGDEDTSPDVKEEQVADASPSPEPIRGKDGLDRYNSADFSETRRRSGNLVDEVFG